MDESIREIIIRTLERNGYNVENSWDGVHVTKDEESIGVKISFEVENES